MHRDLARAISAVENGITDYRGALARFTALGSAERNGVPADDARGGKRAYVGFLRVAHSDSWRHAVSPG